MANISKASPLSESITRIERDSSQQSRIDAHRQTRVQKTLEHREKVDGHLGRVEQGRKEALDRAHAARQEAYQRAGIAEAPSIAQSESKLLDHLDKAEARRANHLQKAHARRASLEQRTDRHIAKIEARDNHVREGIMNERELRHFDREHAKEANLAGHVESARELQLRRKRESEQRGQNVRVGMHEDIEMDDEDTLVDGRDVPRLAVFTVKTSSDD
ncbi:protein of unknown function [Taphrina deformans PYCC 5710]|uniref:Uncharacterized protein n=1 Tax=Taphrina deformans (strain PYCC 5710 / ATCC 11124 / CBS 356.35 / IMI 108563 / JCM 9778 / NBRC 8474) TaxID=1097556 RepID=R4XKJ3_TAPDE|nr:protein of unknown function [Taphrina deformans PYCC 5710]|eukprot:CCG83839.1 protein of unknown function [Taphrina deformans PYCC 5710]